MWNVDSVQLAFISHTDFRFVRYPATNNSLPWDNLHRRPHFETRNTTYWSWVPTGHKTKTVLAATSSNLPHRLFHFALHKMHSA
jgi:hypothetical protein